MNFSREDLELALEVLYDYEYVDVDKFYNCKGRSKLIDTFESGDDEVLHDFEEELQSFLNFETNYNLTIGDLIV